MIKLLSEIPEVGKVPKHVGDAMFASDGQMGVAFACSLPVCVRVCPCVYGGSRVCRRDLRFSALLSCHPVQVAGSQLRWGFSANLRPAGRDGTFWSEWWRWLCGRPPRLLEVKNLRVLVPILAVRGGPGRVQPWLSGSRQVRDSEPAYSAFFSPHSTKCGPGGQFWGGHQASWGL